MISINKELNKIFNLDVANVIFMVSGGIDSIAASHYFFNRIHKSSGILFHFNHKIREQNDIMQLSVESYQKKFNNLFKLDIGIASEIGYKSEEECRRLRFDYLDSNYKNSIIVTAHHLDDCVESYLLNCFRGKEGFIPIPFYTKTNNNLIVHPFLFTRKIDFYSWVKNNDLSKFVVEDESNNVIKGSRRNLIRKEILPILEREEMGISTIVKKKIKNRLDLLVKNFSLAELINI